MMHGQKNINLPSDVTSYPGMDNSHKTFFGANRGVCHKVNLPCLHFIVTCSNSSSQ